VDSPIFELCTAIKDKNYTFIYEGDIVSHVYAFGCGEGKVIYSNGRYILEQLDGNGTCDEILQNPITSEIVIVGNIHEGLI